MQISASYGSYRFRKNFHWFDMQILFVGGKFALSRLFAQTGSSTIRLGYLKR